MKKIDLKNSEHYKWGDNCDGWHLLKRDDASVIREKMPAGTFEQMHLHESSRQFFYILSGVATFVIQNEKIVINAEEGLEIPPKVAHQIRNEEAQPLEFILFSYPTTRGDRVNVES